MDRVPDGGEVATPSIAPEAELGIPAVGRVLHGKERERAIARHIRSLENPIDYERDFSDAPIAKLASRRGRWRHSLRS